MLISIPGLLSAVQVAECRKALETAPWTDGKVTAGYLSRAVKNNVQVPDDHPIALKLGNLILDELDKNQLFISAALPLKIVPPLFNSYTGGQAYGDHIDGAVRPVPSGRTRVRTDLSATVFLTDPADYDGGELVIDQDLGRKSLKLAAGDMVLYPGGSVHHVAPVTRGTRIAAFFWIQSMVREEARRDILFAHDSALQALGRDPANRSGANHEALVKLAGVYHNMLRQWSDT